MQGVQDTTELISQSASEFWEAVGGFLPALLAAFVLIIFGALVAKAAEMLTVKVLDLLGVNKLKSNKRVSKTLKEARLEVDFVNVSGRIVFWVVIVIFAMTAVDVLGLTAMRDVLRELIAYLPNVLAAAVVLTVTIAGARLVRDAVATALTQLSVDFSLLISRVTYWAVILFGTVMTLDQLGFDTSIIATNVTVIVAGIMLALGLAFGLGGKDHAKKFLDNLTRKKK